MRRRLLVLFALLLVPATPARASDPIGLYASALRVFDPQLSPALARRLAVRVVSEADGAGIDARLVVALVAVESSWTIGARSSAGAQGLGQLMPGTAANLGVDPADPDANLHGTVTYLRTLLGHYANHRAADRYVFAIAAYNAGPGAVDRARGIPPFAETQTYVTRVVSLWRWLVTG